MIRLEGKAGFVAIAAVALVVVVLLLRSWWLMSDCLTTRTGFMGDGRRDARECKELFGWP